MTSQLKAAWGTLDRCNLEQQLRVKLMQQIQLEAQLRSTKEQLDKLRREYANALGETMLPTIERLRLELLS